MNLQDASVADLKMMFENTVVKRNNIPVFIHSVNNNRKVDFINLGNSDEGYASIEDGFWDFKPVSTGYVNIMDYSFYITRIPRRQYKQGLHHENIKIGYNCPYDDQRQSTAFERVKSLRCKPLYNTINNVYPSLQQALELLEDECVDVAFDRQFSVDKGGRVYYKTRYVGDVDKAGKIVFFDDFEFLRKAL